MTPTSFRVPNLTQFMDEELDYMESYVYGIEDEQVTDVESMLDRLSRPLTKEGNDCIYASH